MSSDALLDAAPFQSDGLEVVRQRERISRRSMIVADALAAVAATYGAIDLSERFAVRPGFLLALPIIVLVAKIQGLYDHDDVVIRKSTLDELPRLVNLATLTTLIIWCSRHLIVAGAPSTVTLLKLWGGLILLTAFGRVAARAFAARVAPPEHCLFVGDQQTARRLNDKLSHSPSTVLVGTIGPNDVPTDEPSLRALVAELDIHRFIISSPSGAAEQHTIDLVRAAKAVGVRVTISPGVLDVVGSALVLDDVWGMKLLGVPRFGLTRSSSLLKRGFDMIAAGLGLILLAPLLAVLALMIKLDSPGPVLFRQRRVGRSGKVFEIFKLRTMVRDAEQLKSALRDRNEAEGIFKIGADPRITRVGAFLRKLSLDELPQLINVIRGEMSLVGPRPLVLDEDELILGFDRRRLVITPGITGPWQILGSARVPLQEMTKLDYMYVANWSLWEDVKILVRTVNVVVGGRGQ